MRISELKHSQNPWTSRITWAMVYLGLIATSVVFIMVMLGRIRTYSIPTGGVELSVPYSEYLAGESISFTVINNYSSPIYVHNSCPEEPLSVYRLDSDNRWQRLHATTDLKNCENQPREIKIPAKGSITASFDFWSSLFATPGKYRVAIQIQYYNALPYQDFEVIEKPVVQKVQSKSSNSTPTSSSAGSSGSSNEDDESDQSTLSATTYTVHVNSSGVYDITSLSMRVGDYIKIVYQSPYHDEVRTKFTGINGTSTSIGSITVDEENTSATRLFSSTGTWQFRADDHSGNNGVITVSP